jgi:hypothetical protein
VWTTGLAPTWTPADADGRTEIPPCQRTESQSSGLAVLRRSLSSASGLKSPWTGWRVEVGEKGCALFGPNDREASASIRREGTWTFVAWEAPHGAAPNGRLWIADGLGLRAYRP